MNAEDEISCPECGHDFRPADRCWWFCFECGVYLTPDEDVQEHKQEECIKRLGMGYRLYSEQAAEEKQEEWIQERRGEHEKASA